MISLGFLLHFLFFLEMTSGLRGGQPTVPLWRLSRGGELGERIEGPYSSLLLSWCSLSLRALLASQCSITAQAANALLPAASASDTTGWPFTFRSPWPQSYFCIALETHSSKLPTLSCYTPLSPEGPQALGGPSIHATQSYSERRIQVLSAWPLGNPGLLQGTSLRSVPLGNHMRRVAKVLCAHLTQHSSPGLQHARCPWNQRVGQLLPDFLGLCWYTTVSSPPVPALDMGIIWNYVIHSFCTKPSFKYKCLN